MSTDTTNLRLVAVALLACAVPCLSIAHDGPEHEIEELTERMKKHGESADLLTERAAEYRVLGKLAEATKDLERASTLDPESIATHRELGRVLFLAGKDNEALATVSRGLRVKAEDVRDQASLHILRAEILRAQKEYAKALKDCDAGLELHRQNPEWYLLRSDIQKRFNAHEERLAGLEIGIRETGAGILEIERVEALLDAGEPDTALATIETELAESRVKSSWLIRRARALLGLGRKADAEVDLKTALEEIATRLNPKSPDVPLLLDKALAHELLADNKEALRAYQEAREKGAPNAVNEKIKTLQEPAGSAQGSAAHPQALGR